VSKRKVTVILTDVEIYHVLTALRDATRDGSYYGNRDQFYKRHARINGKLEEAVKESERKEGRK
jgi:hypothetical protein